MFYFKVEESRTKVGTGKIIKPLKRLRDVLINETLERLLAVTSANFSSAFCYKHYSNEKTFTKFPPKTYLLQADKNFEQQ